MRDETVMRIMKALLAQDEQEKKKLLAELTEGAEWEKFLRFTDKEISRMPQKYRKLFRVNGLRAYMRKRVRGKSVNYEIRCRMDGVNISAGGTTVEEARKRFIEKLNEPKEKVATTYREFCLFYFEKFRKRKVSPETYRHDLARSKNHIFPMIGDKPLSAITPTDCQNVLDALTEKGFGKTADEAYSLMNCVFKGAIAHNIISRNPMSTVIHVQHERENGIALSLEQEAMLVKSSSPYRLYFLIALYTGMRPNEYSTLRREGDMLIVKNSKRKGNKIEYKRIPICPMLHPYIGDLTEIAFPTLQTLYKNLRKELGCCLYDLRTTFNTRCVECHVDENARKLMMGHSLGKLADAYTHVSDDFLKKEAKKLCYDLPL